MVWYWEYDEGTDPTDVDEIVVVGETPDYNTDPLIPDPGNVIPWDEMYLVDGVYCALNADGNVIDKLYGWLYDDFNQFHEYTFGHPPAWVLSERDRTSTFDPTGKIRESPDSSKWYDPSNNSYWMDLNGNCTPETNFIFDGGDIWVDTDFDGNFEHRVSSPDY